MEIRVPLTMHPDEAAARVRAAAEEHGLVTPEDAAPADHGGVLVKTTPMGSVRARWEALENELVVTVEERPAFLPEGAVRRALEDGLKEMLASS